MGIFNGPEEQERKAKLKKLEDKRVAFALKLAAEGFAPERMLFAQTENGGFVSLSRFGGQHCLIISPGFGTDEDFILERYDALSWRMEEVHIKSEGMGGIFGFGKKAEIGVEYIITREDGSEVKMPFIGGRNGWLECKLSKNPLLRTQRRRGDANVVWDMIPLDSAGISGALKKAAEYFPEV
ncbi:MAG: hypothetical protein IJ124_05075 [Clostridia bacterium]|nr:hypothetical protein [Clostridia bacterium]